MRTYTEKELYDIASVFHDFEAQRSTDVFAGLKPLYTHFYELSPNVQKTIVESLRQRIDKETLPGYLERKKHQVGADLIRPVEDELRERGLL